jgi:hypothetical protein
MTLPSLSPFRQCFYKLKRSQKALTALFLDMSASILGNDEDD